MLRLYLQLTQIIQLLRIHHQNGLSILVMEEDFTTAKRLKVSCWEKPLELNTEIEVCGDAAKVVGCVGRIIYVLVSNVVTILLRKKNRLLICNLFLATDGLP